MEAPNLYDDKQDWLKNQNGRLETILHARPIFPRSLVDIVVGVEQERQQEMFIELDDFYDCIEEKEDADFSTD